MKLNAIHITNYSFNCSNCKSTTTIKYETISGNHFCDKCILNANVIKIKQSYTPILIGDYNKITFREFKSSEDIVRNQITNLKGNSLW